jgi:4'-phosphopantetheinyl transferase
MEPGTGPDQASAEAAAWPLLDAAEQARAARLRVAADRAAYIAAHALLRRTLSTVAAGNGAAIPPASWRFATPAGGKPAIHGPPGQQGLHFSLSHARGMVACAAGYGHDLGVDVEAIGAAARPLELARRFFAPEEAALIASLPPGPREVAFCRIWTLKEAYLKATGTGILAPLDGFAFSLDPVAIRFPAASDDRPDSWQFAEWAVGLAHRLALAVRRPAASPIMLDAAQDSSCAALPPGAGDKPA